MKVEAAVTSTLSEPFYNSRYFTRASPLVLIYLRSTESQVHAGDGTQCPAVDVDAKLSEACRLIRVPQGEPLGENFQSSHDGLVMAVLNGVTVWFLYMCFVCVFVFLCVCVLWAHVFVCVYYFYVCLCVSLLSLRLRRTLYEKQQNFGITRHPAVKRNTVFSTKKTKKIYKSSWRPLAILYRLSYIKKRY